MTIASIKTKFREKKTLIMATEFPRKTRISNVIHRQLLFGEIFLLIKTKAKHQQNERKTFFLFVFRFDEWKYSVFYFLLVRFGESSAIKNNDDCKLGSELLCLLNEMGNVANNQLDTHFECSMNISDLVKMVVKGSEIWEKNKKKWLIWTLLGLHIL